VRRDAARGGAGGGGGAGRREAAGRLGFERNRIEGRQRKCAGWVGWDGGVEGMRRQSRSVRWGGAARAGRGGAGRGAREWRGAYSVLHEAAVDLVGLLLSELQLLLLLLLRRRQLQLLRRRLVSAASPRQLLLKHLPLLELELELEQLRSRRLLRYHGHLPRRRVCARPDADRPARKSRPLGVHLVEQLLLGQVVVVQVVIVEVHPVGHDDRRVILIVAHRGPGATFLAQCRGHAARSRIAAARDLVAQWTKSAGLWGEEGA
jgi:hypothetical protein